MMWRVPQFTVYTIVNVHRWPERVQLDSVSGVRNKHTEHFHLTHCSTVDYQAFMIVLRKLRIKTLHNTMDLIGCSWVEWRTGVDSQY